MDYSQYIGSAGSAFASVIVLATYSMKTMIPLRVFGILSNIVFIVSSLHFERLRTQLVYLVGEGGLAN